MENIEMTNQSSDRRADESYLRLHSFYEFLCPLVTS